ncbi:MAG: hypothetical protein DSM106950_17265 [Stigonema ocellatum SAG 48.90 = DSM 106950]|nr:hypothetical protein [Stigonema ocellatum SAG 48.90 = DSM 106950]
MIGFIKNLISGIVNFFSGLFGGKKSSFYLELKEDAEAALDEAKSAASNAKKAVETAASNTKKAAETAASNTKKAVESVKETAPAASNGKKTAPAKVELVQTAKGVKAEPAKKAKASTPEQPQETTFAPKYLIPTNSNGTRRRPGANMSSFLDMARQVKTPG